MEDVSSAQVLKNPGFLNLWVNQILVQLSYNSLNFALIIWVFKLTDSNTAVSALLLSIYLPAVLFGLFAGVLVDISDRKKIILSIDLLLAVLILGLLLFKGSLPMILLLTFLINTLSQFYTPAESSAIPIIVKRQQLLTANSIFSTTLYVCFLLGFGLVGPVLDRFGINFLFLAISSILSLATLLAFFFPSIVNKADEQGQWLIQALERRDLKTVGRIGLSEIQDTLRLIKGKLSVLFSILIMASAQAIIGVLAVLIPSFFEKIIRVRATNASYILVIPLGIGMVLGGLMIGRIGHRLPRRLVVASGILLAGVLFFLIGVTPIFAPITKYLHSYPLPFIYQLPVSSVLALGAFLLGIAMVSVIVPSQTVLQENTPEEDRGKVFAALSTAMYGLSLLPTFSAGILADVFGAMPIFIFMGGAIFIFGLFAVKPDFFFEGHHLPQDVKEFLGLGHWAKKRQSG